MTKLLSILNILFIPIYAFFIWFFMSAFYTGFIPVSYMILIVCNISLYIFKKDISEKMQKHYHTLMNSVILLSVISSIYLLLWLYFVLRYLIHLLP